MTPATGISVDCLEITDLLPGSIIVKFKIKGDKASLPAQPSALAANLLEQASALAADVRAPRH